MLLGTYSYSIFTELCYGQWHREMFMKSVHFINISP